MAYPRTYPKKKTVRKTKGRKGRKPVTKLSKPMKSAVQNLINKNLETKFVTRAADNFPYNGIISSKTEWLYPLPTVYQAGYQITPPSGSGAGLLPADNSSRIGNTIRPLSAKLHVNVAFVATNAYTQDLNVVLWVFTSKRAKAYSSVSNDPGIDATQFLDAGDGLLQAFDGTFNSSRLPVNKDSFDVIAAKRFRLAKGPGLINNGSIVDTFLDNAAPTHREFVVDLPVPKTLHYEGDLAINPSNFCPIMCIGYYRNDGTVMSTTTQDIQISYRCNMFFKDA